MPYPDLVLNIRKPVGWTSFDVVRLVKRLVPRARVGHAGTLDPFAEGVLLLCTGKETRTIQRLVDADKEYVAQIRLGMETDTLDVCGKLLRRLPVGTLSRGRVEEVALRFIGETQQMPPRFSALKKNGVRWFELARKGVEGEPEPRSIVIHELEILQLTSQGLAVRVRCSKGTYIRALARDLAGALGTVGFVNRLERTRIGSHTIAASIPVVNLAHHIEELKKIPSDTNADRLEHKQLSF